MRKWITVLLIASLLFLVSCHKEERVEYADNGRYYLDRADSEAYIEVSNEFYLRFHAIDMIRLEQDLYESWEISHITQAFYDGLMDETEFENSIQEVKDQIDLHRQFSQEPTLFEYVVDENTGQIGYLAQVEGSELWLVVEYHPNRNALIFDELIFIFRES